MQQSESKQDLPAVCERDPWQMFLDEVICRLTRLRGAVDPVALQHDDGMVDVREHGLADGD